MRQVISISGLVKDANVVEVISLSGERKALPLGSCCDRFSVPAFCD